MSAREQGIHDWRAAVNGEYGTPDPFSTFQDVANVDEDEWIYQVLQPRWRRVYNWDGRLMTPSDYPPCLAKDTCDCDTCTFFFEGELENECRLKGSESERDLIWSLIGPAVRYEQAFRRALERELRGHGRELHYATITRMVQHRHPRLKATESEVLRILRLYPDVFEQLSPGIYRVSLAASRHRKD